MTDDTTPTPTPEQLALAAEIERDIANAGPGFNQVRWANKLKALMDACKATGVEMDGIFAKGGAMDEVLNNCVGGSPERKAHDVEILAELKTLMQAPNLDTARIEALASEFTEPRKGEALETLQDRLRRLWKIMPLAGCIDIANLEPLLKAKDWKEYERIRRRMAKPMKSGERINRDVNMAIAEDGQEIMSRLAVVFLWRDRRGFKPHQRAAFDHIVECIRKLGNEFRDELGVEIDDLKVRRRA
jgi:hypothetical protein